MIFNVQINKASSPGHSKVTVPSRVLKCNRNYFICPSIVIFVLAKSLCGISLVLVFGLLIFINQSQIAFGLFENLFGPQSPCLSKKDSPLKTGFLEYINSEHNIQLQYPSGWTKEEINGKYTSGESTLYSLATFQPN